MELATLPKSGGRQIIGAVNLSGGYDWGEDEVRYDLSLTREPECSSAMVTQSGSHGPFIHTARTWTN